MKKTKDGHIVLTPKESDKISDLLYTLAAVAGASIKTLLEIVRKQNA